MDQDWGLNDEQWSEVDRSLLNCRQSLAYVSIRELIGLNAEAARHVALQRFYFLRAKRPDEFAWKAFPCEDYLASEWADHGCWDTPFTTIIGPAAEAELHEDLGMLVVGGPGFDGILWGYRSGRPGLWQYVPMTEELTHRAATVESLLREYA